MAEIDFDDVPFEQDAEATPPTDEISFDDVPMEEPKAALPVGPRVGDKVPISAREPSDEGYTPFANEGWWDTTKRMARTAASSVAETVAGIPEGSALRERETVYSYKDAADKLIEEDVRKRTELETRIKDAQEKAARGDRAAADLLPQLLKDRDTVDPMVEFSKRISKRADEVLQKPVEESPGFAMAEQIREVADQYIGPLPQDNTFTGKLAQGMGSMLAFVGTSIIGGRMGGATGATATGALVGSNVTAAEMFKEAREAGADERTAMKAARTGAVLGSAEVIPILTGLKYLPRPLRVNITNAFLKKSMEVAASGGEEALQEYLSQVAKNFAAANETLGGYDPDRPLTKDALEGAIIGGILGVGTGVVGEITSPSNEKAPAPDEEAALNPPRPGPSSPPVPLSGAAEGAPPAPAPVDPDQVAAIAATQPPPVADATQTLPPEPPAPTLAPPPPAAAATPPITPPQAAPVGPNAGPAQAPPAPATPTQAERIREIARARQAAQQPSTAPQSTETGVAEGPQAGGLPAAPTSPPVTSEGNQEGTTPAASEVPTLPATPPTATPPKTEAPKRVRTFNSESAPDILHAAGLKTGEIAALKKGDQTRLTSLIRSALKSQYSPEELNAMPREEYNAAVKGIYDEIKAATATPARPAPKSAAPSAAAPVVEAPIAETPAAETPAAETPAAETPVLQPAPSITDAPSEGRVTKGSEISAEERARILAELEAKTAPKVTPKPVKASEVSGDAPLPAEELAEGERKQFPGGPKGEKIVEISETRSGRVLKDTSEQGAKKEAEAQAKAQALAAKQAAETKAAEERAAKLEQGPQGAKMNPVEVARRQANRTAATEIVQEFVPDNKSEKSFEDNTFEGNKAREAIRARAKRMVAAVEKRMAADDKGNKLPKSRKSSAKEEQALSPEILLLMEARDLAKTTTKTPSVQAVARFRSAEALLRSGMVDEYMASRRTDTDIANRKTPDLKTEEGESIDAAQTIVDTRATPETVLENKEDAAEDVETTSPADWAELLDPMEQNTVTSPSGRSYSLVLETGRGGERIYASERLENGEFRSVGRFPAREEAITAVTFDEQQAPPALLKAGDVTVGAAKKKPPVVVVTRTGRLDRAKVTTARAALSSEAGTAAERAKIASRNRSLRKDENTPEFPSDTTVVEVKRKRNQKAPQSTVFWKRGDFISNNIGDALYELQIAKLLANDEFYAAPAATDFAFFDEMMERITPENFEVALKENNFGDAMPQRVQYETAAALLEEMKNVIAGVPVYIVPDTVMNQNRPNASGFYDAFYDAIVLRESLFASPSAFIEVLTHEGSHAMLWHTLRSDPEIHAQIGVIAAAVEQQYQNLTGDNPGEVYGFTNADEFLSEFISNPDFAVNLAVTPISRKNFADANVPAPSKRTPRTALQALKDVLAKVLNLPKLLKKIIGDSETDTALDYMTAIVDRMFDLAPNVRGGFGAKSMEDRQAWAEGKLAENEAYNTRLRGVPEKYRFREAPTAASKDRKPLSNWNKLLAGGVPRDVAREINDYLKAEIGKSIDPATVPLLIADYITTFGQPKATSAGNAAAPSNGMQPPYQPPPTPGMGPALPITPQSPAFRGSDSKWKRRLGRLALKNMTLDFMRQKHGDKLVDNKGSILKQVIEAMQKRDNLALEFAKPINEITAEFTDLIKANPKEAMELADIAMEATRLDVRLGPNADNSHLGKNKALGLQGKQRLAALNQRYDNLSSRGRDIYKRLTTAYRDAHNQNMEALVYNILAELPQKLSTGDVMYLMGKVTSGTLDANDAALVNDPIIFNGLKNAQGLKTIKGDYFPQMRFGNWVVKTREKLVDPGWTSVPMKQMRAVPGKPGQRRTVVTQLPARTEVDGNALRVIVDPTVRGSQTAAMRALRDYAAKQDLTLQGIETRFRDRQTGKLVSKGEQMLGRTYDTVYEARFQTEGVQFFDDEADAYKFRDSSPSNVTSEVLTRIELEQQSLPDGSVLGTIVKRINNDKRLSPGEKKLFDNVVKNAIIASMDGNSARSRYVARRNVKGASKDIARAAVTYGQAAGNFNATLQTAPDIRDGMERLETFASEMSDKAGGGQISDIAQELRDRMATIEGGNEPWKVMQNIATLSFLDKLLTPSHSIVNGLQPAGTTMPVLAGRYGFGRANVALGNAYRKSGAVGATVSGVKNSAIALKDIGRTAIDTDDVIGSMRKNLGKEYEDLIDRMLELGAVSPDAGQEVAAAIEAAGGRVSNAIGRVDRFARQLPNAVEAINRVVTAVATYDLAKGKKSKQEAIQEAIDTVFNTQGDYRKKNSPRWMQHPSVSWALQFKKYGQMMYQLSVDMWHRSFKAASPEERKIARKQLAYLYMTQAAMAGVFGLSGLEILKLGFQALALFGFPTWEEEEEEMRKFIEQNTAWPISSIINNGLLSTVTQLDFAGRLGQGDLALGFLPKDMEKTDLYQYFGQVIAGAPGGTVVDWTQAGRKFAEGDFVKGLELMIPIKQVSDIIGTARGVAEGKLGPYEAAAKVVGFRSLETAEESRQTGADIRDFKQRKKTEKKLYDDLREALANKDRAAEFKARKALRQYRKDLDRARKTEQK